MKKVLFLGGYDPTNGAGVGADLRAAVTEGVYPLFIPTVLTIQGEKGLSSLYPVEDAFFSKALDTTLSMDISAVKIGLVTEKSKVKIIDEKVHTGIPLVLDPVLSVTRGGYRAPQEVIDSVKKLIPLSTVLTPNREEASILTGERKTKEILRSLKNMGARFVLLKGGDIDPPVDILFDGENEEYIEGEKIEGDFHGTGCSLASLIASNLAKGMHPREAVIRSIETLREGLRHPIELTKGWFTPFTTIGLEKLRVLRDLERALSLLKGLLNPEAIPEVGSNLCYALPNPKGPEDVAGFPGRIHRIKGKVAALYPPEFGGSSHVARALITAYRLSNGVFRAAMNIRFNERFIELAEKNGIKTVFVDRTKEPEGVKTMEWVVKEAFRVEREPRVVYDRGDVGKEAMIRVFGKTPFEVVEVATTITGGR